MLNCCSLESILDHYFISSDDLTTQHPSYIRQFWNVSKNFLKKMWTISKCRICLEKAVNLWNSKLFMKRIIFKIRKHLSKNVMNFWDSRTFSEKCNQFIKMKIPNFIENKISFQKHEHFLNKLQPFGFVNLF